MTGGLCMLFSSSRALALGLSFCLVAAPAYATKDVSSPTVAEGKLKFDARYGLETDDTAARGDRFRQVYVFEYGVTRWWSTRLNIRINKPDGMDFDYTNVDFENKFQFFFEKQDGFSGAVKLVYSNADNVGTADTFEVKGMAEKNFGDFRLRGNLGVVWQLGGELTKAADLNAALQGLWKLNDNWSGGAEFIGDFGQLDTGISANVQEHYLGPVFVYKFNDTWSIETGYLVGISDTASDGLFKLFFKGTF
jgi:hypothetical protein